MGTIYQITVNGTTVYIGQAKSFETRRNQHWTGIFKSQENKYQILRACLNGGYCIEIKPLIEHLDPQSLNEYEQKWIKEIKPVLNSKFNQDMGRKITIQEFFNYYI